MKAQKFAKSLITAVLSLVMTFIFMPALGQADKAYADDLVVDKIEIVSSEEFTLPLDDPDINYLESREYDEDTGEGDKLVITYTNGTTAEFFCINDSWSFKSGNDRIELMIDDWQNEPDEFEAGESYLADVFVYSAPASTGITGYPYLEPISVKIVNDEPTVYIENIVMTLNGGRELELDEEEDGLYDDIDIDFAEGDECEVYFTDGTHKTFVADDEGIFHDPDDDEVSMSAYFQWVRADGVEFENGSLKGTPGETYDAYVYTYKRFNPHVIGEEIYSMDANDEFITFPVKIKGTPEEHDYVVTGGTEGTDYTYNNGVLRFLKDGTYTVSMREGLEVADDTIEIQANGSTNPGFDSMKLTLDNVNIDTGDNIAVNGYFGNRASNFALNLILKGTNNIKSNNVTWRNYSNYSTFTVEAESGTTDDSISIQYGSINPTNNAFSTGNFTLKSGKFSHTAIHKEASFMVDKTLCIDGGELYVNCPGDNGAVYINHQFIMNGGDVTVETDKSCCICLAGAGDVAGDGVLINGGNLTLNAQGPSLSGALTAGINKVKNIIIDTPGTVTINTKAKGAGIAPWNGSNLTMKQGTLTINGGQIGILMYNGDSHLTFEGGVTEIQSTAAGLYMLNTDKTVHYSENYIHKNYQGTTKDDRFAVADSEMLPGTSGSAKASRKYVLIIPAFPVTYDLDGGALAEGVTNPGTYTTADNITLNNPSKEGYDFIGWTGTGFDDPTVTVSIPVEGVTGALSFKANYKLKEYEVKFETGEGASAVADQTVEHGSRIDKTLVDPVKDGYTLEGWYTDEGLTEAFDLDTPVTGPLTLHAKWTENDATFKYVAGKGGSVSPKTETVKVFTGEAAGSTATAKAADGYDFVCWTDEEGNTVSENAAFVPQKTTGTGGAADKYVSATYTANFEIKEYTISYELDGGKLAEGVTNPDSYTKIDTFTLNNPSKEGYAFAGWTGTGLDTATETVTVAAGSTGKRSYTATYTKNFYKVEFETNGGTAVADQDVEHGERIDASAVNTTKDGFALEGWYTDEGLTEAFDLSTKITSAKKLYAKWTEEQATFKYVASEGGSVSSKSESVAVSSGTASGSTATADTDNGYTFVCWTDEEGVTVSEDATFVPQKTGDKYVSATYIANFLKTDVEEKLVIIDQPPKLTYNGEEQTAYKDNEGYSVENGSATDAGTYKAILTPRNGFVWSDGSKDPKEVSYTISKAKLTAKYEGETIEWYGKPAMKVSVSGFVGGDTAKTAKDYKAPVAKAPATKPHKTYTVKPSGGSAANYTFKYVSGKLNVKCKAMILATVKAGKNKANISWLRVPGATAYEVYYSKCGKGYELQKTLQGEATTKMTAKNLTTGTWKVYVKAIRVQGGKTVVLAKSPGSHVSINNAIKGRTNPTGVKVNKTSVSVKKGKKVKIKGSIVSKKPTLGTNHCAVIRYKSSDPHIAKVDKKGKITGKMKGKCDIYVFGQNGVYKKVKVTVK